MAGLERTKSKGTPRPQFELNLPEHLPSSPLCPKNSKHKSGGTGICVYHGRRRGASLRVNDTSVGVGDGAGPAGYLNDWDWEQLEV